MDHNQPVEQASYFHRWIKYLGESVHRPTVVVPYQAAAERQLI